MRAEAALLAQPRGNDRGSLLALAYVGAFGSLTSLWMITLIWIVRTGLSSPPLLSVGCAILAVASAFAPLALPSRWRSGLLEVPWVFPLVTLGVLLSPALVFVTGPALALLYPLIAARGMWGAAPWLSRVRVSEGLLLLSGPLLLALYLFTRIYHPPWDHVFAPEFARFDSLRGDTLLHAALAHLIQETGRPSSGLDGLVPMHYHFGSHVWFAAIGSLTHTTPLYSYVVGTMAVVIPALYGAVLLSAQGMRPTRDGIALRISISTAVILVLD
jgi:hypothetical protein